MFFRSSRDVMLDHLEHVKGVVIVRNRVDAANAKLLESELTRWGTRHKIHSRARGVVLVLLYASVLSAFSVPVLNDVVQTITTVASVLGVGILSLLALYFSFLLRESFNKMLVLYGHLIAIYEKNNKSAYSLEHMPS